MVNYISPLINDMDLLIKMQKLLEAEYPGVTMDIHYFHDRRVNDSEGEIKLQFNYYLPKKER